jgi:hypothetical protein
VLEDRRFRHLGLWLGDVEGLGRDRDRHDRLGLDGRDRRRYGSGLDGGRRGRPGAPGSHELLELSPEPPDIRVELPDAVLEVGQPVTGRLTAEQEADEKPDDEEEG